MLMRVRADFGRDSLCGADGERKRGERWEEKRLRRYYI
jgi:hypothetical protein